MARKYTDRFQPFIETVVIFPAEDYKQENDQTTVLLDFKIDLFFQQWILTVLGDTKAVLPVKAPNQPVLYFMCRSGAR